MKRSWLETKWEVGEVSNPKRVGFLGFGLMMMVVVLCCGKLSFLYTQKNTTKSQRDNLVAFPKKYKACT